MVRRINIYNSNVISAIKTHQSKVNEKLDIIINKKTTSNIINNISLKKNIDSLNSYLVKDIKNENTKLLTELYKIDKKSN